jgi:hypothetical protein
MAVFVLLVGCSSGQQYPPSDAAVSDLTVGLPESDGGGFDFQGFATAVNAANASCTTANCAAALIPQTVTSAADAHQKARAAVAKVFGPSVDQLAENVTDCSAATNCDGQFNHQLYKGDGCRADALFPSAKIVVASATNVEIVDWTPSANGVVTSSPAVSIAGIRDGHLLGIVFFFDRTTCFN